MRKEYGKTRVKFTQATLIVKPHQAVCRWTLPMNRSYHPATFFKGVYL
jgi:hypothetical protein